MKRRTVVLILESDRVELVTSQGGRVDRLDTLADELDVTEEGFRSALRKLKPRLTEVVTERNLGSSRCCVYYRSAGSVVQLVSVPTTSAQAAVQAAELALGDGLGCPLDAAATDAAFVCRSGEGKTSHAVAFGDRARTIDTIVEIVEAAGLRFQAAVPIDGPMHIDLVRRAAEPSDEHPAVHLHLGLCASALAVIDAGKLTLFRPLAFSVQQLLSALRKPFTTQGVGETFDAVDLSTARAWLGAFGVPSRDETIDEERGVTGAMVRPLLQPILQRLITEIRQSIRFGVAEDRRQSVQARLEGGASDLRNLAATLHHELNLPVEISGGAIADDIFAPTRDLCLLDAEKCIARLQPRSLAEAGRMMQFKRHLWTGVAAAGVLVALDAGLLHQKIGNAERAVGSLEVTMSERDRGEDRRQRFFEATQASLALENDITRHLSTQPPTGALLRSLARITSPRVRLLSIDFRADAASPIAVLEGYADAGGRGGGEVIRGYIADLTALPAVAEVELSSVQDVSIETRTMQQFRLTLRLFAPARALESGRIAQQIAKGGGPQP